LAAFGQSQRGRRDVLFGIYLWPCLYPLFSLGTVYCLDPFVFFCVVGWLSSVPGGVSQVGMWIPIPPPP